MNASSTRSSSGFISLPRAIALCQALGFAAGCTEDVEGDAGGADSAIDSGNALLDTGLGGSETASEVAAEVAANTAPTLSFTKPDEGAVVQAGAAVTVSLEVKDDGGAAKVTVHVQGVAKALFDGSTAADGKLTFETKDLPAGAVTLVAKATDSQGLTAEATRKLLVNTAPGAPVVAITPALPTTKDALVAKVVTDAVDPDRKPGEITYAYGWAKDGAATDQKAATVPAGIAKKGETWKVTVTPADPFGNGTVGEAQVVIQDAEPATPTVALNSDKLDLSSEVSCTVTQPSVDADGDAVTYSYVWLVGGVVDPAATTASVMVADLKSGGGSAPLKKGDKVQCQAVPVAASKTGPAGSSAEVEVAGFDVCASAKNPCAKDALCENTATLDVLCFCKPGFGGDGKACTDLDECTDGTAGCDLAADCSNTVGGATCACKAGYTGDGKVCKDVDECAGGTAGCDLAADCSNTVGGVACLCKPGYEGNGKTCADIDECSVGTSGCDANAACKNVAGSATCACNAGYSGNGKTCTDVDECAGGTAGCDLAADCSNTAGSATCTCKKGYEGDGKKCADIDECVTDNGGCGVGAFFTCKNNTGGAPTCSDIDECAKDNGGCGDAKFWACKNNTGAASTCTDIDECATLNGGCGDVKYMVCKDNDGGLATCTDIDECKTLNGGCGDAKFFTCANQAGLAPVCADIDECKTLNGGCGDAKYVTCKNNVGGVATCTDINECLSNNGGCGAAVFWKCANVKGDDPECGDIDECATDNGKCGDPKFFKCANQAGIPPKCSAIGQCLVNNGGCGDANFYSCTDNPGKPPTCADINECLVNNGGCGNVKYSTCSNQVAKAPFCMDVNECLTNNGGCGDAKFFTCKNNNIAAPTCADIDECAVSNGGCGDAKFTACKNNVGAGPTCSDINECLVNNGGCGDAKFFSCSNQAAKAQVCADINECLTNNGGCGAATAATCSNQIGKAPVCTDINECLTGNGGCNVNATCTNNDKIAPTCACKPGFVGDGKTCASAMPEVANVKLTAAGGCITVTYDLYQPQGQPVDVTATAIGGDGTAKLATTAVKPGKAHVFVWNSTVDVPPDPSGTAKSVQFRITPKFGTVAGAAVAAAASINNNFSLAAATSLAVGTSPRAVLTGDLNRDGKPDLLAINSGGASNGSVSVRLGDGLGGFTTGALVSVGSQPLYGVLGDFNRDGKLDLAVANYTNSQTGTVSFAPGKGDGTFGTVSNTTVGLGPISMAVGDLNLDGNPDLVVGNFNGGTVSVLLGKGDGTFTVTSVTVGVAIGLALADLNQDGLLDLVANQTDKKVAVLPGDGKGAFGAAVSSETAAQGASLQDVVVSDWNRDGFLDAVVVASDSLSVMLGNGKGALIHTNSIVGSNQSNRSAEVGDFNQDGIPDLAIAAVGSIGFRVLTGNGTTGTAGVAYSAGANGSWEVAVADFDLDGVDDFAIVNSGSNSAQVVAGTLPGRCGWGLAGPATYDTAAGTQGIAVADFNKDGIEDIAAANGVAKTVTVNKGTGTGGLSSPGSHPAGDGARNIVAADFNHDGWTDIANTNNNSTGGMSNSITVHYHKGAAGGYAPPVVLAPACGNPDGLATADLNRDGWLDLVATCNTLVAVSLQKAQVFPTPTTFSQPGNPNAVVTGDFNRDGIADLALTLFATQAVSIQLGKGDGAFLKGQDVPLSKAIMNLRSLSAADVNNDGKTDLLVTAEVGFRLLMGNGDGTFGVPVVLANEPAAPRFAPLVDLNRDGKADFVAGYSASGELGVYVGDGKGAFSLHKLYGGFKNGLTTGVATGDFDRDGRWDVAVGYTGLGKVGIYLQKGVVEVACADGIKNGNETAVDCGGDVCAACGDAMACVKAADCGSGLCSGGVCKGTVLLLHMDGADGAKVFADSSPSKHVITPSGDAKITTADSKFGGASAFFDGTGDFLSVADSADWNLGTGDFTIDFWMRSTNNVQNARMHTFSFGNGTNANIEFDYNDKDMGGWGLWVYWNGTGGNKVTTTTPYTDGKWHHMALVRQGQVMKVYVDGKAIGASAYVPAINVSGLVKRTIGIQSGGSLAYLGWLDEVRMVKGAAKWTANFLPPTAAY